MLPQTGHNSHFIDPPLNLPFENVLDFHLKENPTHPIFTYPTTNDDGFRTYNYTEFVPAVHRFGQIFSDALQHTKSDTPHVVVMLLQADPITYLTALSGLMRAGIIVFPVSYRFSPAVIAYLLRESQTVAIIVNSTTESLANQSIDLMDSTNRPIVLCLSDLSSVYPGHNEYISLPNRQRSEGDVSVMTHSSSSTSLFPKIISWSSYAISHHSELKDMPGHSLAGKVLCTYELEFFHSLGMCVFFTMVRRGLILGVVDASIPSSDNLDDHFQTFVRIQPSFIMTNPRAIETWAEDQHKVTLLRELGVNIVFGGRFLRQNVGDMLVHSGVRISSAYGCTETGPLVLFPDFQGEDWEYFTLHPSPDVNFVSRKDDLLEIVVSPTSDRENYLAATNVTWCGRQAYNPGDLFIAHPTKPYTYKMFGRLSDQILLASGETVNPIEFETEICKHPLIASAVMFGHSRPNVGVVIEPKKIRSGLQVDVHENEFLQTIWPTINEMNGNYPPYSTISKQMIIVASANKPISIAPKGLPRRPLVWQQYQDEIDTCYRT